ncbi:hypothetical protein FZEAL_2380 [Fusarium zealandicum]|uniref:NADP-dependent oxidoreductase domain-containing protein n=1 Tax=Fusarium zealandicum TaxID=1053134 RepID=A0A8H4XNY0_9HYPO|nr:hypothetical protein FZEAL_2380 [Fusarium zealandicum]
MLRRAVKIAPVAAVQVGYSPFERDIEGPDGTDILAAYRQLSIPVVAAMPRPRGMVTVDFTNGTAAVDEADMRKKMIPRFSEENRAKNMEIVGQFKTLADRKGRTTAQLSLAWLMKQGDDIISIPGTKRIKYLEENWASLDIHLTDGEEAEIRKFVQNADVAGGAVPDGFKNLYFGDTKEEVEA